MVQNGFCFAYCTSCCILLSLSLSFHLLFSPLIRPSLSVRPSTMIVSIQTLPYTKHWNSGEGVVIPLISETGQRSHYEGMLVYPLQCSFQGSCSNTESSRLQVHLKLGQRFKQDQHENQKTEYHDTITIDTNNKGAIYWTICIDVGNESENHIYQMFSRVCTDLGVVLHADVTMNTEKGWTLRFNVTCMFCDPRRGTDSCHHLRKLLDQST